MGWELEERRPWLTVTDGLSVLLLLLCACCDCCLAACGRFACLFLYFLCSSRSIAILWLHARRPNVLDRLL